MARWMVLLIVLGALASRGSALAASPMDPPGATCGDPAGMTLAHSGLGRVYVVGHWAYGCVDGAERLVRLGSDGVCPGFAHFGPVAVTGEVAAYASRTCGVDTAITVVIVRRLSDGRVISSDSATDVSTGPESFQSVGSIVVRSGGAVAWIGSSDSIATHHRLTEVLEHSGGSVRRLDQGSAIQAGSLRLRGSTLTWQHGLTRRSAALNR
ncbi:MAG: hypothetical protein ACR2NR_00180 [Solirubrobacteraceae bacterium]